ncbi:MAG: hypothetical protein ABSE62_00475 [Chthoniobacteraceae bacterium]|jgi:hypothetical protein
MSNWTTITADDIKAVGYGMIVDKARTMAVGGTDPAIEAIANAVSRVRRAVASGNTMDIDATKVPNSLKSVTVKLALYDLMRRLRLDLSSSESEDERNQISDLKRIDDSRKRVEAPDHPDASGEMQGQPAPAITRRRRQFRANQEDGTY